MWFEVALKTEVSDHLFFYFNVPGIRQGSRQVYFRHLYKKLHQRHPNR